jgi:hypothetical protein
MSNPSRTTYAASPQYPAALEQRAAPQQDRRSPHHQHEERPEARHDVVAEIQQRDVRRPLILWELVEPLHRRRRRAVDEKAQRTVDDEGVVDALMLGVRLTE